MRPRELAVGGALEFSPEVFADDRGFFGSPYQESAFIGAVGKPLFPVSQASLSRSRRGVVRGVHFTVTPPGTAKYVYCPSGKVLDIVVDLRVGSPTFGRWDSVVLDPESLRALYLPVGLGHAFVALEDETMMSYLLSSSYIPELEQSVSVFDKELALLIPDGIDPILSERDLHAPTLAKAEADGILPVYDQCRAIEADATKPYVT